MLIQRVSRLIVAQNINVLYIWVGIVALDKTKDIRRHMSNKLFTLNQTVRRELRKVNKIEINGAI